MVKATGSFECELCGTGWPTLEDAEQCETECKEQSSNQAIMQKVDTINFRQDSIDRNIVAMESEIQKIAGKLDVIEESLQGVPKSGGITRYYNYVVESISRYVDEKMDLSRMAQAGKAICAFVLGGMVAALIFGLLMEGF